jgi:hypothetical protein
LVVGPEWFDCAHQPDQQRLIKGKSIPYFVPTNGNTITSSYST